MIRMTVIALIVAAVPAAAETIDAAGTGIGVAENKIFEIAEGHMVMHTVGIYDGFDSDGPFKDATGECFGEAEMQAGDVSGSGACVFNTEDGETALVDWEMQAFGEGGATTGVWTVTGGTGRWATATGGGEFNNLTDPEAGRFENTISGEVTFE